MSVVTLRPQNRPLHQSKRRFIESDTEQPPEHLHSAFKQLGRLRKGSLFCDVILEAEDGQVSAHKVVLACRCSYFRAMFMCGTRESWATQVKLNGISLKTLDIVVGFIYNDKICILGDDVQGVISAADMMDLGDLKVLALKCMTSLITSSNCLGVWKLSELYSCNIAVAEAKSYALKNFSKVRETSQFLELDAERLTCLLGDDMLRIARESEVLDALTKWFNHDQEQRKQHMSKLLNSVRFHLFGTKDIVRAMTAKCGVPQWETVLLNHLDDRNVCTVSGPSRNPARRKVVRHMAIVVGGHQESSIWSKAWGCDVEKADNSSEWHPLRLPLTQRRDHVAIGRGRDVIIAGGSNGANHINNVERYDGYTGEWQELPGMLHPRNHLCGALLKDTVYVGAGTNDSHSFINTIEMLDVGTMRWLKIADLDTPRRSCAAAATPDQLMVVGGAGRQCMDMSVVEMLDPRQGVWRQGPPLLLGRRGFGLIAIDQNVYALGGYTSHGYTSSIEQLDLRTNTWVQFSDLPLNVGYFGCSLTHSNQVLICGGVSNSDLLVWDISDSSFTTLSTGPPLPYSGTITTCGAM